jgi:glycosyltransferase involved in cell wall biosynthesis
MTLKLLFISCAYRNLGVGDYTYDLKKALEKRADVKITLLSRRCYCERIAGKNLYECKYLPETRLLEPFDRILMGFAYSRHSCLSRPDIIHYQLCGDYFGIRPLLTLAMRKPSKLLVTTHEIESWEGKVPRPISHALWGLTLKRVDKIIAHSQYTRKKLLHMTDEQKIVVIPHGVHLGPVFKGNRSEITFFGSFAPRKGFPILLKALKILKSKYKKNVKLFVYGFYTQSDKARMLPLIDKLGLRKNVCFGGLLSQDEFYRKISESLFVVVPYLDSNASGIILKSMAHQTPVVTTSVGSIPEYVGRTGILVPPGDEEKLAEGMYLMLNDKKKRIKLGREARQRIKEHYTWHKVALQTFRLYQEILLQ